MTITPFELLDQLKILSQLQPESRARLDELMTLDCVDSTNDYLLKIAHTGRVIACFAEHQTAGKGQRGKHWASPRGGQIYFSLLWPFDKPPGRLMGLSLAMGIAAARALHHYGVANGLQLKWPNDLYYNGKKLGGILLETAPCRPGAWVAVIGIGVNVHLTSEQAAAIDQPWISLHHILQRNILRNQFAGMLLEACLQALIVFSQQGLAPFHAEWQALDYLYGKRITLTTPQQTLTGKMLGISIRGELLLMDDQQQQHVCLNGTARLATI